MQRAEFRAYYGVMDSGKSLRLLQHAYEQDRVGENSEAGVNSIIAKPGIDTKAGSKITSRLGLERDVDILIGTDDDLRARIASHIGERALKGHPTVYIDEMQFLSVDQATSLRQLVTEDAISVNAYGLATDFTGAMFPATQRILENADYSEQLMTYCRGYTVGMQEACGNSAIRNARLVDDEYTFTGATVAIDGEKNITYRSLCDFCYTAAKKALHLKAQRNLEAK